MIVLDASAAVELLLCLPQSGAVANRLADPDEVIHSPHLLSVEVAQVIRRYVQRGQVQPQRGETAIADLADLDIEHHANEPFLPRMWRLRENLTAYDAAYITLAEALDAPLLTLDARLAAAPGHHAVVEVLAR